MKKLSTEDLVKSKPNLKTFAKTPRHPLVVVLDNIRSLQNVGLFFRLADALRIEKLYLGGYTGFPPLEDDPRLPGSVEHAEREIEKTAIKTIPYVPWERAEETLKLIKKLKKDGYQVISVEQTDKSVPYTEVDYNFPVALVFGHERDGISDEVLKESDLVVDIPMYGMGNSLNVATSFSVIGYELVKQLEAK
jgi:23S rRNA (guanosine2251-2'-O)-methyltransferase